MEQVLNSCLALDMQIIVAWLCFELNFFLQSVFLDFRLFISYLEYTSLSKHFFPNWFKGVIWCDFKFFFLFGVLQADCA